MKPGLRAELATLLIMFCLLFATISDSKATSEIPELKWSKSYECYGGGLLIQTSDGGFAIVGIANSVLSFIKIDSLGELQWVRTYGPEFGVKYGVNSLVQTVDSGFAMCYLGGYTSGIREKGWFLKTDSEGKLLENESITIEAGLSSFTSIDKTNDGGVVLTSRGVFWNMSGFSELVKIDTYGNILWSKIYSTSLCMLPQLSKVFKSPAPYSSSDSAFADSAFQTIDGGYALSGNWNGDAWSAKTDSHGEIKISKTYGYGDFTSVIVGENGDYILCGFSGFGDGWLQKIDSDGNVLWSFLWNHKDLHKTVRFESAKEASEGGCIAVGTMAEYGGRQSYPFFARIDSTGNILFNVTYTNEDFFSVITTNDSGFAIVGSNNGNLQLDKFVVTSSSTIVPSPSTIGGLISTPIIAVVTLVVFVVVAISIMLFRRHRKNIT